jgi:putative transcriptional regulator
VTAPALHLPPEVALDYANGNCSEALSLAAASHLTFCAVCRDAVTEHERRAQALIESLPGVPLPETSLEQTLARLDEPFAAPPAPVPLDLPAELRSLPLPVQQYAANLPNRRWRLLAPGVRAINLPLQSSTATTARIIRFRPGFVIPLHDHEGAEYTVVFSGSIAESGVVARRGDLIVRAPGDRHTQKIADDETCIALVVNEAPLIPLTFKGRLLRLVTGL